MQTSPPAPVEKVLAGPAGQVRLTWLAPNAMRVTYAGPGAAGFPADRPWMKDVFLQGQPGEAETTPRELDGEIEDGCLRVRVGEADFFQEACWPTQGIRRRVTYGSLDIPKFELRAGVQQVQAGLRMALAIRPGEMFYGWGEWFNAFNRGAGRIRLKTRDAISMLQGRETYSAIPIFFSSRGYAFFLLNSHISDWKIDPQLGRMELEAYGPPADYLLIYGPDFKRIIATYTALTGRPPLLPRWAFGLWVTSYPQEHQQKVLELVAQHRQHRILLDAAIFDYHWEAGFHNFRWRPGLFPDPQGFIRQLNENGVRLGLIITPFVNHRRRPAQKVFLNTVAHNLPKGHEQDDERCLPEYQDALAQGLLAHPNAAWWFGWGGMLDFTNPRAGEWWQRMMRPLYEQGVAFFKNDDGEYLPLDARSANGMGGEEYHNLYGFYYGKALYDGMRQLDDRRALIYARSVWAGSQRCPALFLGDQKPTFESLRRSLRAGLNLGLLGFAYWTADVFGLDGKTTLETHMRYAQWALLAPVARYFCRPAETDDTRFPWSHGEQAEANFRFYTNLRYRLLPLYTALGWQAHQTGLPVMRPMLLEFQEDQRFEAISDQVMLGESLMLCPVVEAGALTRRIVLPAGVWHDFWSQQTWQGPGEIDYPAPLERLPMLVRGGTILPMGPELQSIPDEHRFDRLELHLWPPYPASFTLFDDDGRTCAYERGEYSRTPITAQAADGRVQIQVGPAQGGFSAQVTERQVELVLHRSPGARAVRINGQVVEGWAYDDGKQELKVRVVCRVAGSTLVEIE